MRRKLIAGNWKMHGSRSMADALVGEIAAQRPQDADVLVFPPFPYLASLAARHAASGIGFGGQDVSAHQGQGAYTGEVSAAMLADVGAQWVLVGHSERRQYHHESDELVALKFAAACAAGLTPVLCVGETLQERDTGQTEKVLARQLDAVLAISGIAPFYTAVIAYEPVWAIGTGKVPTSQEIGDMHGAVRHRLIARYGQEGEKVRILYGGSVKGSNAAEIFAVPDVDGALVGGASLTAADFLPIIEAAAANAPAE